ncbi:hypothetical protein KBA73_04175 [Patescibacteria group bacterium]|nr:hypothetical protein [Patescibacteria group bacterium]
MTPDVDLFTAHVPVGRRACLRCCIRLTEADPVPGLFVNRELEPVAEKALNLCTRCAGTGLEDALGETNEYTFIRLLRNRMEYYRGPTPEMRNLDLSIALAHDLVLSREEILERVQSSLALIATERRLLDEDSHELGLTLHMLDTLLLPAKQDRDVVTKKDRGVFYETLLQLLGNCQCEAGAPPCRERLRATALLEDALESLQTLYPNNDADTLLKGAVADTEIYPIVLGMSVQLTKLREQAHAQTMEMELELCCLIADAWYQAGEPRGCLAESLVRKFRRGYARKLQSICRRRLTEEEMLPFKLTGKIPSEIGGVTAALLADLYDLVCKYGARDSEEHVIQLMISRPVRITVTLSSRPEMYRMLIIQDGVTGREGVHALEIRGAGTGDMILWDKRIEVRHLRYFIDLCDRQAAEVGLFDFERGERILRPHREERSRMSVEAVFSHPGAVMPVFPGQDAEALRQGFDRPECVVILEHPLQGKFLCHIDQIAVVKQRQALAEAYLAEHGIKIEDIAQMSFQEILQHRDAIGRIMQGQLN